nr:hypothetical protein [Tanacetum cinerariifolium]
SGRLDLQLQPGEVGEFLERDQLPLQTLLLIPQSGGPVTVSDDQQQGAFAPRGDMAMLARSRLQLTFQQSLKMSQALSMAENGF